MDRPYIVCHILSALDGKIAGTFQKPGRPDAHMVEILTK